MYKVQATIEGMNELRYNRFVPTERGKANRGKRTDEQETEDAWARAYYDEKKGFYIPSRAVKKSICEGGTKVKVGRSTVGKTLNAILLFSDRELYLNTHDGEVMESNVRIPPRTGAMVMKKWVIVPKWKLTFLIVVTLDSFPDGGIEESIQNAGLLYGLLDGRPEYGRFELKEFKRIK